MAQFPRNNIMSLVGTPPRHDLGGSYGPNLTLGALLDTGPFMGSLSLGYRTAEGDAELRKAIANLHTVSADDVVVTVGSMHALFLLAFILCDRGDEAVLATPVFPPARTVLQAVGANVRTLPLSFDSGYQLDPSALAPLLSDRTRLVSLASPQNPSGVCLPPRLISEVLAVMRDKCPNAYLVLDETYREAAYGHDAIAPSAVAMSPNVISVASLSKCHGAPGLRLGWAVTRDATLRSQLVVGKFNTVVACSAVDESLALRVFADRERILAERREFLAECLAVTASWVSAHNDYVDWVRPDAGAICCIRLKPAVFDDAGVDRFYQLLADADARVSRGDWFEAETRVFRLGFGHMPIPELKVALQVLGATLTRAATN